MKLLGRHSRMRDLYLAAITFWLVVAVMVSPGFAQFSPVRPAPPLPPPAGPVVNVSTVAALENAVATLTSGTTIVIAPGIYQLTQTLRIRNGVVDVALRGATGNRDDVVIRANGMNTPGVDIALKVENAQDVLIADLSIGDVFNHPIQLQGEMGAERVRMYNLRLFDAGQQFVKSTVDFSNPNGVDDSVVEYSLIEFTTIGPPEGYTEGIDVHHGDNWIIRYNLFRNIRVPPGASFVNRPAVLMWSGSENSIVHSNVFINCERGIIFGLDPQPQFGHSHFGGMIYNNFIYRTDPVNADAGISVWDSPGTKVFHNTVIQNGTYPDAIEYRFAGTTGVEIVNNLTDGQILQRDGATGSVYSNFTGATPAYFVNAAIADLHLTPAATQAIDLGVYVPLITTDWDGEPRPAGAAADIGADEVQAGPPPGGGATAVFVGMDPTQQGNWQTGYGGDGYVIVGDATSLPAYATVTATGHSTWVWTPSTADVRALLRASGSDRVAAAWYGQTFEIDANLTGGQPHQVAIYMMDWDANGRSQRVDVLDAANGAVLDTRTVSSFEGGQYLVWTIQGHVRLRLTGLTGANAVLSGVFFGLAPPPPGGGASAVFVGTDTTHQGNWQDAYGDDGYAIVGDATNLPGYATVTPVGHSTWVWSDSTSDVRALRRSVGSDRVAATWYGETFDVDVNLTGGQARQVAIYMVDWDPDSRSQRVDVLDAATGAILDTRTVTSFQDGQYLVWTMQGHVRLRLTRLAGANAVVSGIFFGG